MDKLVSERPTLRFAVGIFDTWTDVQATVRDLTVGGMAENSFNCLGLHRVLAPWRHGLTIVCPSEICPFLVTPN